jgi:hypothetical protein
MNVIASHHDKKSISKRLEFVSWLLVIRKWRGNLKDRVNSMIEILTALRASE